jgi:hypothetical protein
MSGGDLCSLFVLSMSMARFISPLIEVQISGEQMDWQAIIRRAVEIGD